MAELSRAEIAAGFRTDPENGEKVRPGCMNSEESRVWWKANRERWMAVSFAKEPPGPAEEWAWTDSAGWTRRQATVKAKKS